MKPEKTIYYLVFALFILSFGMACHLDSWQQSVNRYYSEKNGVLSAFLGESQGILSALFFIKADVYFHKGFYPSIFDYAKNSGASSMISEYPSSSQDAHHNHEGEGHSHSEERCPKNISEKPLDWIDKLSRNFYPSVHAHAGEKPLEVKELLPWLKLSAEFDPHRIETYTVAAFWLRNHLGKIDSAEEFLRDGLRANPGNPELLFELGKIYKENRKDLTRARNLWELALTRWRQKARNENEPDTFVLQQILAHLAYLEKEEKNNAKAIEYLEELKKYSPNPQSIQNQIDELKNGTK